MIGVLSAELLKLRRRPAVWILLLIVLGAVALLGYAMTYVLFELLGDEFGEAGMGLDSGSVVSTLLPANIPAQVVSYAASFGGPALLVLGVLATGSEYSWRTVRTITTQRPTRATTLLGKLAALALVAAVTAVLLLVVSALAATAIGAAEGGIGDWPAASELVAALGASWLVLSVWTAFGVLLAVLLRGTGLAIGIGLVYVLLLESVVAALPLRGAVIDAVRNAMISVNANSLSSGLGSTLDQAMVPSSLVVDPWQATAVLLAYTVAFAAAATVLFRWREIG